MCGFSAALRLYEVLPVSPQEKALGLSFPAVMENVRCTQMQSEGGIGAPGHPTVLEAARLRLISLDPWAPLFPPFFPPFVPCLVTAGREASGGESGVPSRSVQGGSRDHTPSAEEQKAVGKVLEGHSLAPLVAWRPPWPRRPEGTPGAVSCLPGVPPSVLGHAGLPTEQL